MKPFCSIVIRAYNEEKHIGRLLTGIQQQILPTGKDSIQTILVDSGSTDATVSIARQYAVDIVHIPPQEFTFGRSLNLGIAQAKADLVVIASAHVYPVYPDWLERLLAPFEDPQVALTYGKQRGAETSKYSEHQIFHHWFPDSSRTRQSLPFCNNANAAIRRSLWEEHPYDETLPALEDLAWARWVHSENKGGVISYIAEAEIIHVHQETWRGIYNRYQREAMAFKRIYPQEHFRRWDMLRLWLGNSLNDMRIAAREHVLLREWRNILHFRWNQFSGTYQGYRSGQLTWQLKQTFYYPRATEANLHPAQRAVAPIPYSDLAIPLHHQESYDSLAGKEESHHD
ncbi:MAG TPA: glycosyltransferase family A protein [Anaerolineaceae bacterium]|nr:glycosyltransferase family A protein [Anaerolineaceae bacterium]